MKRLAAVMLLAALTQAPAADLSPRSVPMPTTPQVPAPVLDASGGIVQVSAAARVSNAVRPRAAAAATATPAPQVAPLPTGLAAAGPYAGPGCAGPDCGAAAGPRPVASRLKAWLCFYPTTGDALPKLRPQPYVGRVTGTFTCNSANGGCGVGSAGCGNGGCAAGVAAAGGGGNGGGIGGRVGNLLTGRGSRGQCIGPADDAIPGYHFANLPRPTMGDTAVPPARGYVSQKPPVEPAAAVTKPADPLAKPLTRP